MKKIIKIAIVLIILLIISTYTGISYANNEVETGNSSAGETTTQPEEKKSADFKDFFGLGEKWIKNGSKDLKEGQKKTIIEQKLKEDLSSIYGILLAIGTVLTVIVGVILGIKFMVSSAEDKAHIKEMMIPYVIGCVIIFGAFGIWAFAVEVLNQIG